MDTTYWFVSMAPTMRRLQIRNPSIQHHGKSLRRVGLSREVCQLDRATQLEGHRYGTMEILETSWAGPIGVSTRPCSVFYRKRPHMAT